MRDGSHLGLSEGCLEVLSVSTELFFFSDFPLPQTNCRSLCSAIAHPSPAGWLTRYQDPGNADNLQILKGSLTFNKTSFISYIFLAVSRQQNPRHQSYSFS